ncbi:MAG: NAD(P)/FAD-dependent oxidoreductase, partial [Candidatus Rokuibacteriota bacterium]
GGRPGGHDDSAPEWLDAAAAVTGALGSVETTAQLHPARFTEALIAAALARGAALRLGVVEDVVCRAGAACGVTVDGTLVGADAVVLAMGPWTGRVAGIPPLPRVHGLKGHSVTLAVPGVPAHALFMDYRMTDGRRLEPEIFPRPDGEVYVCGMADPEPLPNSPEAVSVSAEACAVLARAAGRVSSRLAAAPITRRQACYRPVTDDGLPLIGPVPGVSGAFVATGHGPWGMLNAPATGQALAELIAEGAASTVDLRAFDPARLAPVRTR